MSQDTKKPPPFFCPSCGQKHRANIDDLLENPGAVMRARCTRCGLGLAVTLAADGSLDCGLLDEDTPQEADAVAKADAAASTDADDDTPAEVEDFTSEEDLGPSPQSEAEYEKGDHVGRYLIEKAIGFGGTSTVYRAFDPTTNRNVALKVLNLDSSETMHQRFLREIEVQANIRHPNIMPVFDRGTLDDERPYFTMELLYKPFTLQDVVERREAGTLARYKTLEKFHELDELIGTVMVPVADGIYVANVENGVVHRDLKPGNVLVDSRTLRPYVIDFGICHVLERRPSLDTSTVVPPTADDAGIVGTPRFLAPEQVKGSVHARTDVWGLGALLHYIVAGEPPIAGATNISRSELKRRIKALEEAKAAAERKNDERKLRMCNEKLERMKDESLRTFDDIFKDARDGNYSDLPLATPAALSAVIKKAMATNPSDRYVNARQLTGEVQSWLKGTRVRALQEAGGRGAKVESARHAVRSHTATAVWILAGLAAGLLLGFLFASPDTSGASTRRDDASQDIESLANFLPDLRRMTDDGRLALAEQVSLWRAMDNRAANIAKRLAGEPNTGNVQSVRKRVRFVRGQFAPPRFLLEVPEDVALSATSIVPPSDAPVSIKRGENQLPPGKYLIDIGEGAIQFPIVVPLVVRDTEAAAREPAFAKFKMPLHPDQIPYGMRLVPGSSVRPRDLPFHDATKPETVSAFLMDETEVTNTSYGLFLKSLPEEERTKRTPTIGFSPAGVVTAGRGPDPVVSLRAEDARAYAAWRSKEEGLTYRLPTEAEWVLAAGANLGYVLPNGQPGKRTDADFVEPLRPAGKHATDVSPYGIKGLYGNAREMVTSVYDASVLVKGAGVGDDPDRGAIYIHRVLEPGARHATTGFRLVRDIPDAK